jgi:hypothetical protein
MILQAQIGTIEAAITARATSVIPFKLGQKSLLDEALA